MIQNITDAYGNPKTFERAQFAKGADTITNLESHNSIVQICTRSYTQEVMSVKMKRLPEHTHIDPSKIIYQIGPGAEKVYPNADIIVEDCLENLVRLPGDKVKILINKTHNQASLDFDFYHRIYRFADLESSLDFIRSILDSGLVYNKAWRNLKFISTKGE
jgi:5'(3')-deoxyribonucleotidase